MDHMLQHMKANDLLTRKHFDFLQGRSTILQLLRVLADWSDSLDLGISVDAIYMDFQNAFDKVPPKSLRLLSKINRYGMAGEIEDWVGAFLAARKQKVCVNGR